MTKLRFNYLKLKPSVWWDDLKYKISNFDIKPTKPVVNELLRQAIVAIETNDNNLALRILHKILMHNRSNFHALDLSIEINFSLGRDQQTINLLKSAIIYYPDDVNFCSMLGYLYTRYGKFKAAAKYYQRAVSLNPQAANLRHFLDVSRQQNTVRAPKDYIVGLFDGYAENFEQSLIKNLLYTAHVQLVQKLRNNALSTNLAKVLDLGCGTGLLGQELCKHFTIADLQGVDLSTQMLAKSQQKEVYRSLHNADILDFITQTTDNFELIVSSDALIYLGDLELVFSQAKRILQSGGCFAFTLERLVWGSYKLSRSGRYQHSHQYLKSLYKKSQFSKMYSQTIDLRMECGNMVTGYLVLLQK